MAGLPLRPTGYSYNLARKLEGIGAPQCLLRGRIRSTPGYHRHTREVAANTNPVEHRVFAVMYLGFHVRATFSTAFYQQL